MQKKLALLKTLSAKHFDLTDEQARSMLTAIRAVARELLVKAGFDRKKITAIHTKFNDAGRRSAPWKAFSQKVPGRPQDGEDGNRINRWLMDPAHKFYATEVTATLVQVRYYLQLLSMKNAPPLPPNSIQKDFTWLTGHEIIPDAYQDPIQLISIDLREIFANNLRLIQSGHYIPLDRQGKHEPKNAFLMLARSNQLQGNLTVAELVRLMGEIVERHGRKGEPVLPTPAEHEQIKALPIRPPNQSKAGSLAVARLPRSVSA